ncbi:MAG: hypothetical protein Crog4KO_26620 [Crocinitomicaceae bacterium]
MNRHLSYFSCLIVFCLSVFSSFSQEHSNLNDYQPTEEYDNVHVVKIAEDDLHSTYIIWVKESVAEHYHASHTENIVVIQGKARMTINGEEIIIKKGDFINIPEGTKHAVVEVLSHKPLKVLSTQTPIFDGKDRIFTES